MIMLGSDTAAVASLVSQYAKNIDPAGVIANIQARINSIQTGVTNLAKMRINATPSQVQGAMTLIQQCHDMCAAAAEVITDNADSAAVQQLATSYNALVTAFNAFATPAEIATLKAMTPIQIAAAMKVQQSTIIGKTVLATVATAAQGAGGEAMAATGAGADNSPKSNTGLLLGLSAGAVALFLAFKK